MGSFLTNLASMSIRSKGNSEICKRARLNGVSTGHVIEDQITYLGIMRQLNSKRKPLRGFVTLDMRDQSKHSNIGASNRARLLLWRRKALRLFEI